MEDPLSNVYNNIQPKHLKQLSETNKRQLCVPKDSFEFGVKFQCCQRDRQGNGIWILSDIVLRSQWGVCSGF